MARQPAEVFPPGEFIRDALDDRGWNQEDLAAVLGKHPSAVADLIASKRELTVEWAQALAEAFNTSPEVWLKLEAAYRLSKKGSDPSGGIRQRARIYDLAPIREMYKRGWISDTRDSDVVEANLCSFFGVTSLENEPPHLSFAARKSTSYEHGHSPAERAWIQRVVNLADTSNLPPYDEARLRAAISGLSDAAETEEGIERVSRILTSVGVPLVIVKHLNKTKIDGACIFVNQRPVIGLSLRYGRIDNFWFTLMHEIGHALAGASAIDVDLTHPRDNDANQQERLADNFAAAALIDDVELEADLAPMLNSLDNRKIVGLARKHRVHPGIITGRLQHKGLYGYGQGRAYLVDVRDRVLASTISDGWR